MKNPKIDSTGKTYTRINSVEVSKFLINEFLRRNQDCKREDSYYGVYYMSEIASDSRYKDTQKMLRLYRESKNLKRSPTIRLTLPLATREDAIHIVKRKVVTLYCFLMPPNYIVIYATKGEVKNG